MNVDELKDFLKIALPEEKNHFDTNESLYELESIRGLYEPSKFLVRLNPEVRELIDTGISRLIDVKNCNAETITAFSTYLHETIHWWQHIGSTSGLMLSFADQARFFSNFNYLKKTIGSIGPKKSLKKYLEINIGKCSDEKTLNIIINNWHDIEFNKRLILDPLRADAVINNPYFESVGHSLHLGLAHSLLMLSSTLDENFSFLPDVRKWGPEFEELRNRKKDGFHHESRVVLAPLGAVHIFEGQARFSQIQYLYLTSNGELSWEDFEKLGMLSEKYKHAFESFLKGTGFAWPKSPIDPIVNLFLLVCELAINPSDGYPFDIFHFESFVHTVDPGMRFVLITRTIRENPHYSSALTKCNREEYLEMSVSLNKKVVPKSPIEISKKIIQWLENEECLKELMRQNEEFDFGIVNLPVRVYFARHIRFQMDRFENPEFFCWPGLNMSVPKNESLDSSRLQKLWRNNEALFLADLEGEVKPRLISGVPEKNIYQTTRNFFGSLIQFALANQWTVEDGPFNFDFTWLGPKNIPEVIEPLATKSFLANFGVEFKDFEFF